jgi:hypothetical protein
MEAVSIVGIEDTERSTAQTHRFFEHRIENRSEIAG